MMDDFLAILGAIALIIATVLVLPFISFWLCYFGGWVASITIGNILTDGLNTLFQTTWFTKDMIPLAPVRSVGLAAISRLVISERARIKRRIKGAFCSLDFFIILLYNICIRKGKIENAYS